MLLKTKAGVHSFTGGGLVLAQSTRQQEDDGRLNDKYYWQYAIN